MFEFPRLHRKRPHPVLAAVAATTVAIGAVIAAAGVRQDHPDRIGHVASATHCTQHYRPATGFDIDVCLGGDGASVVSPSITVNQATVPAPKVAVRAAQTPCHILLEVWDDAGNRLDPAHGSDANYPCTAGTYGGWPLNLAALQGRTVHTAPDGSIAVHAFARLVLGGQDIHISGQGDSPSVTVNPTVVTAPSGNAGAKRPGCDKYNAQGLAGYTVSVCIKGDAASVSAASSVWVEAARPLSTSDNCTIDIEVWDDKGHRLADTPVDCAVGLHTGNSKVTVSANTTVHAFARLTFDGRGYRTGDSPSINLAPVSGAAGGTHRPANWCPVQDSTMPVCDQTGAFQNDQLNDYKTLNPDPQLVADAQDNAATGSRLLTVLPTAHEFFQHYLDGTGSDLNFDATQAYKASWAFYHTVNDTAGPLIADANKTGAKSFDSGYQSFEFFTKTDPEWAAAMGHCFFRVTGQLQQDGTWTARLWLTSYYQFRDGTNFSTPGGTFTVYGTKMRYLEKVGLARNFREVGGGTLTYDHNGGPTWIPQAPAGPA